MKGTWAKSPPELEAIFRAAVAAVPGTELRRMFGYPAAFANGHLMTGLFEDDWMVRLPPEALAELSALGGAPFSPMPGRPMREYLTFPRSMLSDPGALAPWLERSRAFVLAMPPKAGRA
jgi:TfoX/Sxy family transcriptional regulator of competence genes